MVEWLVDPGDPEAVPELRTYVEAGNSDASILLVRLLVERAISSRSRNCRQVFGSSS